MTTLPPPPANYFARARHQGRNYLKILARLHALKRPQTYLEVGTATGKTLAIARCASVAIDPDSASIAMFAAASRPAIFMR